MEKVTIETHGTNIVVKPHHKDVVDSLVSYNDQFLSTYDWIWDKRRRKRRRVLSGKYYVNLEDKEFYYPITLLRPILIAIFNHGFIRREEIKIVEFKPYKAEKIEFSMKEEFNTLKPYQKKYVRALNKKNSSPIKLVVLQTGKGKTIIALHQLVKRGKRFAIFIKPEYISKWIEDITEKTTLTEDDFYVVNGSDRLKKLMYNMDRGVEYKVIIVSLNTYSNIYLKEYEENNPVEFDYLYKPLDLLKKLKIDSILIDEAHESFKAVFRSLSATSSNVVYLLSATFSSTQANSIMKLLVPESNRIDLLDLDKYAIVNAIGYLIHNKYETPHHLGGTDGKQYSHIIFEQNLLKNKELLEKYLEMIEYFFKRHYIDRKRKGDKALIFAATKKMVRAIKKHLARKYKSLKIGTYVEDDEFDALLNNDVSVSTIISAGTAVDIKGLIYVALTTSIDSEVKNIQALGRLREIEDMDVIFDYFYNRLIEKQIRYHLNKQRIFKNRALVINDLRYDKLD